MLPLPLWLLRRCVPATENATFSTRISPVEQSSFSNPPRSDRRRSDRFWHGEVPSPNWWFGSRVHRSIAQISSTARLYVLNRLTMKKIHLWKVITKERPWLETEALLCKGLQIGVLFSGGPRKMVISDRAMEMGHGPRQFPGCGMKRVRLPIMSIFSVFCFVFFLRISATAIQRRILFDCFTNEWSWDYLRERKDIVHRLERICHLSWL